MIKAGTYKGIMTDYDLTRNTELIMHQFDNVVLTSFSGTNFYAESGDIYWKIELVIVPVEPLMENYYPLIEGDLYRMKEILVNTCEVDDDEEVILAKDSDLDDRDIITVLSHIPAILKVKKLHTATK